MATLNSALSIVMVAVGLGLVIFLHELGHFVMAKWNGVKVEKFSIGFGPTLWGFRRGETEYVLAAVPLGGFVKMLGEGPEDEANKSADPRAYPNKSVGARMAIISAGVIMNLFLGLACFVYAYGQGMDENPAKLGGVLAGSPAYAAGLKTGDEIVSVDGRRDITFDTVNLKVRLSSAGQVIRFDLKRPGHGNLIPVRVEARREASAFTPGIGIMSSRSLLLADPPFVAPAGLTEPLKDPLAGLKTDDKLVALGPVGTAPRPVAEIDDVHRLLAQERDRPLVAVFDRPPPKPRTAGRSTPARTTATLPPDHFVDFGFRLTIEPIAAIQGGSIAAEAGFRPGDRIVKVDGKDDFDPMRLPDLCYEHAGKPMTFEVKRAGVEKAVTITATPDATPPWTEPIYPTALNEPLEVPGLGLAYPVRSKIVAVAADSPAAKAGLKPGDVINSLTFSPPKASKEKKVEPPEPIPLDDKTASWPSVFIVLQLQSREPVVLTVNNAPKPITITPEPVPTWFHPLRGIQFQGLSRKLPPQGALASLQRGFDDTVDNILIIYATIRSLVQKRVSPKLLGGPILIARVAYSSANSSLTDLVRFLGLLSINLAVLNFLPIPPLDGGQMAFLLAEKVRGRPLPDSTVIAGTYLGLFLVLSLMIFVLFQDFVRVFTGHMF